MLTLRDTWAKQEDITQTENLSPLRFYYDKNLNFNTTCIITIQNFTETFLSISVIFFLEHAKTTAQNFANASSKQIETLQWRFFAISTPNSKYKFFKVTWKNFRWKMCFDFFESRLKRKLEKHWRESWSTSTRYFEVLVVKLTQTLFLNIILRKILRKNPKNAKFSKFFCCHFGCFLRSKHKQLIECIFMTKQLQKM
jgi:hypothetical protein